MVRARLDQPVPPRRLRARTGAPGVHEFVVGGREAAHELDDALRSTGRSPEHVGAILDLGCGSGRVLPHMKVLAPSASATGSDVDSVAIDWAADHYPDLKWDLNNFEPPLPFAHRSFDLVYSISVFSHLDEAAQDRWLEEVRRVLAPGGAALLSVHGRHAFEQFRTGDVTTSWCGRDAFARGQLEPDELAFVPYVRSVFNAGDLPGIGGSYGLAFHGDQYVRGRWSRWLHVEAVLERALTGWQDIVVCSRESGG